MLMDSFSQTKIHTRHRLGHTFIAIGLLSFLIFSMILSTMSTSPAVAFGTSTIFELTNDARMDNGLETLTLNEELTIAAQEKAEAMVKDGYFEHTAPDGTTGWDYIEKTKYNYSFAGENLAASNENDVAVVDGWLNSPGHRANLLNTKFSEIGLGMAFANNYDDYENVYFIVALYAEPSDSKTITQGLTTAGPGGTASLSGSNFTMNSSTIYLILSLSGLLLLSGIILELRKLQLHFSQKHAVH